MTLIDRVRAGGLRFFFAPTPAAPALRFRRLLAVWTAAYLAVRLPHLEELYARAVLHDGMLHRWFAVPPAPVGLIAALFAALLLALGLVLAGRCVRAAQLATLGLFALLVGLEGAPPRAYAELALIQWLLLQFAPVHDPPGGAPPWPWRLLTLQFASVYLFAALAKLSQGPAWRSGEALARLLRSPHYGDFLASRWLTGLEPPAPQLLAWAVIATELWIALGLWAPRSRRSAVAALVLLHLGMAATLRISPLFHTLMLAHLVLVWPWRRAAA